MGLLDSVLGSVLGGAQQQGGLAGALGGLLADDGEHGGLGGLVEKFNQAGLGEVIGSWIGKGENLPISPDQLKDVLGSDAIAGIAAKLGIDPAQASGQLSQMLPGLIDQLTPHGQAPAGGLGNAGDLLGALGGLLQKR
ncbi:YidB family protein [Variovorax terrae]|uniref:YidB family protein n=1 Tax=Variovorax terrae TaxID=2923278 RepID=A0A9X2AST7_9BURK|nr:YidB family protein [Variovorax terrae]MCJ0765711.1 YidB family protein [Variovorax terrae]